MAFIPVANTYEIAVHQSYVQGTKLINVYHLTTSVHATLTQAIADAWASLIEDAYEASALNSFLAAGWSLDRIVVTDLTTQFAPQFNGNFDALSGTDTGHALPGQTALMAEWSTALRGRSYRGKTFHGGFTENSSDGLPSAGLLAAAGSFFGNLITNFHTVGPPTLDLAIVSRFSGTHLVPGPGGQLLRRPLPRAAGVATPVTQVSMETVWKTQRRRAFPG